MDANKRRLFLALWPDALVREQLAQHCASWLWATGCVPYDPSDWHLTVQFIGDVATAEVEGLGNALRVPFEPFSFELGTPQIWPQDLAVLGSESVASPLQALHERLRLVLRSLSMPADRRPYCPHVTLARRARQSVAPAHMQPIVWRVRDYVLVESMGREVGRYQILRRYAPANSLRKP